MRPPFLRLFFWTLLFAVGGCGLYSGKARIKLRLDGPSFPSGFKCAGILLTGESIPSQDNATAADWAAVYNGGACPYPGLSTTAQTVAANTTLEFSLYVPGGRKTTVQVLGIETTGDCPSQSLSALLKEKKAGTLAAEITGIYELGRTTIENLKSSVVSVSNTYNAATSPNLLSCFPSLNGDLFPYAIMRLFPGDFYYIAPSNGTPPYTFTKVGPGSLVNVTTTSALFDSTLNPGETLVTITDANAKTFTVAFRSAVPSLVGTLKYWYNARSFAQRADGAGITLADNWSNSASGGLLPLNPYNGNASVRLNGGPKGFPIVALPAGSGFNRGGTGIISMQHTILMVARRRTANAATLFCMGETCEPAGSQQTSLLRFPDATYRGEFVVTRGVDEGRLGTSPNPTSSGWAIFDARFDPTSQTVKIKMNESDGGSINHAIATFVVNAGGIILGGKNGLGAEAALDVAEVLVIEGSNNADNLASELRTKYGLP